MKKLTLNLPYRLIFRIHRRSPMKIVEHLNWMTWIHCPSTSTRWRTHQHPQATKTQNNQGKGVLMSAKLMTWIKTKDYQTPTSPLLSPQKVHMRDSHLRIWIVFEIYETRLSLVWTPKTVFATAVKWRIVIITCR